MNFVFDLDGTICFKGEAMSSEIVQALHAVEQDGHRVMFASARPIRDMLPVIHPSFHDNILIGGNGSLVASEQTIIHSKSFEDHDLSLIMNLIDKHDATYLIDSDWDYTYNGPHDHPILTNLDPDNVARNIPLMHHERIIKILILSANNLYALENELQRLDVVVHHHGTEQVLDISPTSINKRTALQTLGIESEGYVAFGNDANDIELFKGAEYSVMIGNYKSLRFYTDYVIDSSIDLESRIAEQIKHLSQKFVYSTTHS
ncbi:HAD-IIB family hydrolase [Exiguobacterium acetylicum]